MAKFQFLLFDAGVIIYAHKLDIWQQLTQRHRITVAEAVGNESLYWQDDNEIQHPIDLSASADRGEIDLVEVSLSVIAALRQRFDPTYLDRMDDGETESLAFLVTSDDLWLLTSGDAFAYKVLGQLGLRERGVSLEEILQKAGLSRSVEWQYTKEFREKCTSQGEQDHIMGRGLKKDPPP